MPSIADAVFNAALNYVKSNVNKVRLLTAGSSTVVSHASSGSDIVIGSPGDNSGSGGGRKITVFSGNLSSIGVSTGGAITKGLLLATSTTVIGFSTASTYSVGSSDTVNLQAFSIILKDPV